MRRALVSVEAWDRQCCIDLLVDAPVPAIGTVRGHATDDGTVVTPIGGQEADNVTGLHNQHAWQENHAEAVVIGVDVEHCDFMRRSRGKDARGGQSGDCGASKRRQRAAARESDLHHSPPRIKFVRRLASRVALDRPKSAGVGELASSLPDFHTNRRQFTCGLGAIAAGVLLLFCATTAYAKLPSESPLACQDLSPHAVKAAHGGFAEAQLMLGMLLMDGACGGASEAFQQGVEWLESAGQAGYSQAWLILGEWFQLQAQGPSDVQQAIEYYTLAANLDDLVGQHRLGMLLLSAHTGPEMKALGVTWLSRAAHGGDALAATLLGMVHARGLHGIAVNTCAALEWYDLALQFESPAPVLSLVQELDPEETTLCETDLSWSCQTTPHICRYDPFIGERLSAPVGRGAVGIPALRG